MTDKSNKISKYQIVKNAIMKSIISEELLVDSVVPSENDIAKTFNVSIVTARKALTDLVHDGFVYRIRGKGSFVKNTAQTNKSNSNMKIISFLVMSDKEADSSTMRLIRGAQTYLSTRGYSLVVECSNDSAEMERVLIDSCIKQNVAGIIIFPVDPEMNIDCYENLTNERVPFVLVDRAPENFLVNYVSSYNLDGAYRITQYLLSLNHKKIAFAAMNGKVESERLRYEGYSAALKRAGIKLENDLYINDAIDNIDKILSLVLQKEATAIICVNDISASMIINHLRKNNIKIPQDVSITGFDDAEIAKHLSPSLTTVRQPFLEIGSAAAKQLIDCIENPFIGLGRILLSTEIIIRDSVQTASID